MVEHLDWWAMRAGVGDISFFPVGGVPAAADDEMRILDAIEDHCVNENWGALEASLARLPELSQGGRAAVLDYLLVRFLSSPVGDNPDFRIGTAIGHHLALLISPCIEVVQDVDRLTRYMAVLMKQAGLTEMPLAAALFITESKKRLRLLGREDLVDRLEWGFDHIKYSLIPNPPKKTG
jgi:hypothetical protein